MITTAFVLQWLFVFVVMTAGDFCWAKYTKAVAQHKRIRAAWWSGAIVACGSIVITSYIENRVLTTAAISGAIVGTYLAMGKEDEEANQTPDKTS